jgi:alanyl-tRNA synthetase
MNIMTSDEVRQAYLSFFESKKHKVISSSSLIPHGDPTLLLTTAGMVQIKPYFLGLSIPSNPRLVSCQKCFRTTDIDLVGDSTHLTFFEMLGNFSVGDYFKQEAIAWAWEFVNQHLLLPLERLWVTIFLDDDEAFDCWQRVGFPEERIVRLGEKDNFWGPAGDSGPCGPCSEIHYDFGESFGCGNNDCNPGCDCGRFSEIWNLVFTQYDQSSDGKRKPLPKPNIDTGMGLERTTAVMQGVSSVYETDLFLPIISKINYLIDSKYGQDEVVNHSIRVVAEHSRGIAFLIADGVLPSNEGRGYVLRRILRKASFFGRKLGIEGLYLNELTNVIIEKMGHIYPELIANREFIAEVVNAEEEKFIGTLDAGINMVEKTIAETIRQGKSHLDGKDIFKLYDTYGFPSELTAEIAKERNLTIDIPGFVTEMEKQRDRARAGKKFTSTENINEELHRLSLNCESSNFTGYEYENGLKRSSEVIQLINNDNGSVIDHANKGEDISVFLRETPFYGEMGGQVGDKGLISGKNGEVEIIDTLQLHNRIVHKGKVIKGTISTGDLVEASVDIERRMDIARNHTATHLLQAVLRQVLGSHVYQRGSLVEPDRLRFDFSHTKNINKKQLKEIQDNVNIIIRQNIALFSNLNVPYKQAVEEGAIALFGEKYGDDVRVVKIGKDPISVELCGGTHVAATGEIGQILILNESSIGTGLRRIEAVTGRQAQIFIHQYIDIVEEVAAELRTSISEIPARVKALDAELSAERKKSALIEKKISLDSVEELLSKAKHTDGVTMIVAKIPSASMNVLREMGDSLLEKSKSALVVLGTLQDGKPGFVAMVTPDLIAKGLHAGEIVKQVAGVTGGSGGGKPGIAQAGGKDGSKIEEALAMVDQLVKRQISKGDNA